MKYIIKNCPAFMSATKQCRGAYSNNIKYQYCSGNYTCLLKQIVEKCKEVTDDLYACNDMWRFADDILGLLELEECE